MEGLVMLLVLVAAAIIILPIITISMVSRTNRKLDTFTRRSERLLDMLFERANDPEASKEDYGIFFNTTEKPSRPDSFTRKFTEKFRSGKPEQKFQKEDVDHSAEETQHKESMAIPKRESESPREKIQSPVNETFQSEKDDKSESKTAGEAIFKPKRNWEKIIGENILNKIGIFILVLGIGYFVRHTFSNQNLQEVGNISIGYLAGIVLFIFGHRLRNKMRAFSSVLVGGAISVFYFTTSIAFRDYELISQNMAALTAVGITAISCFLSTRYNRQELAIISLLGGLASPLMVSSGSGNHLILFSYLVILNAGILFLANKKSWKALHPIAYFGTLVYLAGWTVDTVKGTPTSHLIEVLSFAVVFFGMFLAQNLFSFKKESDKPKPFQLALLTSNSAALFTLGMFLLSNVQDGKWQGLFVAALAIVHGLLTFILFRKQHRNNYLKLLLTGLSLTFVSLVAPIQMSEHHITLFWAAEAAMLSWLGYRSGLKSISKSALLVTAVMLISLLMDWHAIYSEKNLLPFLNTGMLTTAIAALGIGISTLWQKQWLKISSTIELNQPRKILKPLAIFVALAGGLLELNYFLSNLFEYHHLKDILLSLYVYLCAFTWIWLGANWKSIWSRNLLNAFAISGAVFFLCFIRPVAISFRDIALVENGFDSFMLVHYSFYLILLIAGLKIRSLIGKYQTFELKQKRWFENGVWLFLFIAITAEYNHLAIILSWHPEASISHIRSLIGSPEHAILWSAMAFVAMYFGIQKKVKSLRYFGLGLFALALLRLFLFDLALISETGKTIAFVSLGVFLLLVSFMYQRLKALLF